MTTIFLFCALVGGTILLCQFVLTLLGLGGHDMVDTGHGGFDLGHDAGADLAHDTGPDVAHDAADHGSAAEEAQGEHTGQQHSSTWLFGVISFRTLVAAATFFGLAGMASHASLSLVNQLLIALACGVGAMYLVHWLMSLMYRLSEDNTVRINRAVGREGMVYLPVPAGKSGPGKVQLRMQGRMMEYEAVTSAPSNLPAGARVVVVGVVAGNLLEVAPAEQQEVGATVA
jgi:membrane protein implicated in regulation of membrane protease activity